MLHSLGNLTVSLAFCSSYSWERWIWMFWLYLGDILEKWGTIFLVKSLSLRDIEAFVWLWVYPVTDRTIHWYVMKTLCSWRLCNMSVVFHAYVCMCVINIYGKIHELKTKHTSIQQMFQYHSSCSSIPLTGVGEAATEECLSRWELSWTLIWCTAASSGLRSHTD